MFCTFYHHVLKKPLHFKWNLEQYWVLQSCWGGKGMGTLTSWVTDTHRWIHCVEQQQPQPRAWN